MSTTYYPLMGVPGQREDALVIEEHGLDEVWLYLSGQPYGGPSEEGDARVTEAQLDELARAWTWAPLKPVWSLGGLALLCETHVARARQIGGVDRAHTATVREAICHVT